MGKARSPVAICHGTRTPANQRVPVRPAPGPCLAHFLLYDDLYDDEQLPESEPLAGDRTNWDVGPA
jgi:hypothetical protein